MSKDDLKQLVSNAIALVRMDGSKTPESFVHDAIDVEVSDARIAGLLEAAEIAEAEYRKGGRSYDDGEVAWNDACEWIVEQLRARADEPEKDGAK